jgi:hypothetical protein
MPGRQASLHENSLNERLAENEGSLSVRRVGAGNLMSQM